MSHVIQSVSHVGRGAFAYSVAAVVIKSTVILGVAGATIAAIGYGIEKAGEKLTNVGANRGNQSLANIGNRCTWVGDKVRVTGKYTFLAVPVLVYGAGKFVIQVALPKLENLAHDYVVTPTFNAITTYGPRAIHQIGRGCNWANDHVIQPLNNHVITPTINFINHYGFGIIVKFGRAFNWSVDNLLKPLCLHILVPAARQVIKAASYALRKIGEFGYYLGQSVFPILDRLMQSVVTAAQWTFNHIIVPFCTQVLTPIGHAIQVATNNVLYPILNAVGGAAAQVSAAIGNAFAQVSAQAATVFG